MEISEGAVVERRHLDTTFLVIVLEGDIEVRYGIDKHFSPRPGYMFLLPKNEQVTTYAQKSSTLLLCSFISDLKLCSRFSIQQLSHCVMGNVAKSPYCLQLDIRIQRFYLCSSAV